MTTVYIAGDSTAAIKEKKRRPETGWGEKISLFFDDTVRFENKAANGGSTKTFLAEGRLAAIQEKLTKEDYLFIQFGHNDQSISKPERYTAPYGDYLTNLATFVTAASNMGAQPVLLTSISRRNFLEDGRPDPTILGPYPAAMRQFAIEHQLPLLDLFRSSQNWLASFHDPEATRQFFLQSRPGEWSNYPEGITDNTHLNEKGATEIARLVAQAISESALPLKNALL